jgi:hypothetical protein
LYDNPSPQSDLMPIPPLFHHHLLQDEIELTPDPARQG